MTEFGYALSSEEHPPHALVENARKAEDLGFEFAMISDHFHPWTDRQGNSPFVWSVIGAISHATERIRLGTGVTCPTIRSEEHTSELQSRVDLVCRLLLEKKKKKT